MKSHRICTALFSAIGIFLLIIDGKAAISGATEGISICVRSVIPSLFPFLVLGNLLTSAIMGSKSSILRPLGALFRIPTGSESLLVIGFLGGYPVGAQSIANAYRSGQLSKSAAERMLVFCNQAGPSFLFGILGSIFTPLKALLLWAIQMISAFIVSCCIPAAKETGVTQKQDPITLSIALHQAIRTIGTVCGWIILFRICIAFLDRWILWLVPENVKIGIMGLLELANGCVALSEIQDEATKFLISSGIIGFGGVCVTMQTQSVTEGLSLYPYFPGKILQSSTAMLIAWMLMPAPSVIPVILLPIILICAFSLRKMENRSRNPLAVGV